MAVAVVGVVLEVMEVTMVAVVPRDTLPLVEGVAGACTRTIIRVAKEEATRVVTTRVAMGEGMGWSMEALRGVAILQLV